MPEHKHSMPKESPAAWQRIKKQLRPLREAREKTDLAWAVIREKQEKHRRQGRPLLAKDLPTLITKIKFQYKNEPPAQFIGRFHELEARLRKEAMEKRKAFPRGTIRRVLAGPRVNYRLWRAKRSAKKRLKK